MKALLATLMLMSFSSFATEIIKVSDGSVAKCESNVDVYRYRAEMIYRPLDFKVVNGNAKVKIEFYKCIQENGEFKFVLDKDIENRTVVIEPGPFSRETTTIRIQREKFSVVAYRSDDTRMLSKNELISNGNHTYSATLPLNLADLQVNRSGQRYFEMTVSFKMTMFDAATNRPIDSRIDFLGTYRMVIK